MVELKMDTNIKEQLLIATESLEQALGKLQHVRHLPDIQAVAKRLADAVGWMQNDIRVRNKMRYKLEIVLNDVSVKLIMSHLHLSKPEASRLLVKVYLASSSLADAVGMVIDTEADTVRLRVEGDPIDSEGIIGLVNPILL
jgi:hypothetical protein